MKILILTLTISALVWGAPQGKGNGKGKGKGKGEVQSSSTVYLIPQPDIIVVKDYYRGKSLPPGLAKKLARGGTLPPGWQKKLQPVPVVVEQRLAPLPEGYSRGIYDGAYVVYDSRRGVIVDLFLSF